MAPKNILQQVQIESPCSANWDQMTGSDAVRFCEHCDLQVRDVSRMTRAQATRLVHKSDGRLCLRIHRTPAGEIITREVTQKLYTISRRASKFAAGAFTAIVGLSASAYAQSPSSGPPTGPMMGKMVLMRTPEVGDATLSGTIFDANQAVIPNATVTLINEQTRNTQSTTTDEAGTYHFSATVGDTYRLEVQSPGFSDKSLEQVAVGNGGDVRMDITLDVMVLSGAIAISLPAYQTPLIIAVNAGDTEEVARLIKSGVDVDQPEADGTRALTLAVHQGDTELVKILLQAGARTDVLDRDGDNILSSLTNENGAELVPLLVRAGANVNQQNQRGETPLMSAVAWDDEGALRALLDAGAIVDLQNAEGNSALMVAVQEQDEVAVRVLLAAGANFSLRNLEGQDAIRIAKANSYDEIGEMLRAAGAVEPAAGNDDSPVRNDVAIYVDSDDTN